MVFFFFFRKTNAAQNPHLARKVRDEPLGQKQRIVQHVELEARADSVHERVLELRRRHWGVSSGRGRGDSGERQRRRANVDAVFVNLLQWLLPRGRALLLLLVLMPVLPQPAATAETGVCREVSATGIRLTAEKEEWRRVKRAEDFFPSFFFFFFGSSSQGKRQREDAGVFTRVLLS